MQDDAAAAGLWLPGPEDDGSGGAAEVSGSADRAAASLQRVSRRALVTKQKHRTERRRKNFVTASAGRKKTPHEGGSNRFG